jgi:hypothetical protein
LLLAAAVLAAGGLAVALFVYFNYAVVLVGLAQEISRRLREGPQLPETIEAPNAAKVSGQMVV